MQESTLHSQLKTLYSQDGGSIEVWVDGYLIDVVKGDQLIEIQTGNFSALKAKITALVENHPTLVVYPIAREKRIITKNQEKTEFIQRKSPKRGRIEHLFNQLIYIPMLPTHPHFSLEVILTEEEEERIADGKGSWWKKGIRTEDRKLVSVFQRIYFEKSSDYLSLLPDNLDDEFTNIDLSSALRIPLRLASKMTYCLGKMEMIKRIGYQGRSFLFQRVLG